MMSTELVYTRPTRQSRQHATTTDLSLDHSVLVFMIETDYGLIDELYIRGVLNQQQIDLIKRETNSSYDRARRLLNEAKKMSKGQHEQFMSALNKTGQSHVTNYIRHNGQRPTSDTDDWPIIEEWHRVVINMSKLIELIDPSNGLLDELLSVRFINGQQKQLIMELNGNAKRSELLLEICRGKSVRDYKTFIDCLIKTKQDHVVSLLNPNHSTILQPVSEEHVYTLIANYSSLIEQIHLNGSVLLAKLLSAGIITWRQREYIESATTQSESNSRLLDIVRRGSELNYLKFLDCLDKVGQSHVADVLRGGVMAEMVAETSLRVAEEDYVVELFTKLCTNVSPDRKEPLRIKLEKIMSDKLQGNQLIAMKTNHSIKLFFRCTSLTGLLFLHEMFITGQLRLVIEQILATLLQQERSVTVHRMAWQTYDYNKSVQCSSFASGQTVSSKYRLLAQQSPHATTDTDYAIPILPINQLPYELIELVLLKAEGQLFVTLKKLVSCAHIFTMTTFHGVCLYWWETLTGRQKNRQLLIKYCNQQCAPYKFNPKLTTSIRLKDYVHGVAELCSKLFIIDGNTLRVFSIVGSNYCDLGEKITMSQLRNPQDIVACRVTNSLYVSDCHTRCIWRVSSSSLFQETATVTVKKFIVTDYEPFTLSVHANRLVVTPYNEYTKLFVYSCDAGELIKKIELSGYTPVHHAVETLDRAVVVCNKNRFTKDKMNPNYAPSVREVSQDGQVLRAYKGSAMLTGPCYMTTDSKNHFLVFDYGNKSIVHLNRELELEHIVLSDELRGQPKRACYSEDRRRLYVCYSYDDTVDVYRI